MNYENYLAIDWAQNNMAVARMTKSSEQVKVFEGPSSVKDLRVYLNGLSGSKILSIEESTASQWLYTELKESVNKLLICDPSRNRLLLEGPKNDKIDSKKIVKLLRAGLLKEVFHSGDDFIYIRKIVSGYEDLVRSGVRLKNQRSSLLRALGLDHKTESFPKEHASEQFVLTKLERRIKEYETQKDEFEEEFKRLAKKYKAIQNLKSICGIGNIHGVQMAAIVV